VRAPRSRAVCRGNRLEARGSNPRVLPSSGVSPVSQYAPSASAVLAVFVWGASDFSGGFASKRSNAFVVTAFSHLCALGLMLLVALAQQNAFPSRTSIAWALVAGSVGGLSLAIFYRALAAGQMGLTAPVAALLGAAIPTLADIGMEGTPSRWTIAGFVLAIVAIWLITRPESAEINDGFGHPKGVAAAALAGVGFAGFYLCIHQAHGSPTWLATISRVGSFISTAIAVLATRSLISLPRPGITFAAIAGCLDITGSALFIFANQHGRLDQAVVITSLYPAVTVLLARIVLKEHFSRWKFVGLLAALAAVPLISAG
jgi:drug/metabolite transporter (DMT)-like permease